MLSLSRLLPRASRVSRSSTCASCLRQLHASTAPFRLAPLARSPRAIHSPLSLKLPAPLTTSSRTYATKTSADDLIEEIQEQYATARDEFEIASEETEKKSVYAEEDRKAAREELDSLKEMFEEAIEGEDGEEVKRRVGQRIRELDEGVKALEERALED
ncbi:hypothetical protein D0Z07_0439 [Hyphodiscus hymeniophilus]|uniref:Uncharacterized protein n=1 Tax=Hyphodiscus hymeniophilus TaxID=353542 RepID=A0A9P7B180_9HELO|nr:hypothetical protein D0Z07_0439 [Hyphodiscus hymeniophilus]